jgi:molybdopterin adenylyltransferase
VTGTVTTLRAAVITMSDSRSRGGGEDLSGPAVADMLAAAGIEVAYTTVVPDEKDEIRRALIECADKRRLDLIVTTGGTGVSPRDVTPDATREVIERDLPGMAEAMRAESMRVTPFAMISRAVAGIRGCSLIVNLPGSPKAARENLAVILPAFGHALEKIKGDETPCAQ